jgi:arginyl-tRNA synthetase
LREKYGEHPAIPDIIPIVWSKTRDDRRLPDSQRADLQTNAAMQLAKPLKRPPTEIAEVIIHGLGGHASTFGQRIEDSDDVDLIGDITLSGPGFVNIILKTSWLAAHVADGLKLRSIGKGQTVVIDYSSPNVAKPMHIAHIRSTIIGDATKRVLRALGYQVVADNHLGDWGTQFGKLIVAYNKWLDAEAFKNDPVEELLRLYVKYTEEEEKDPALLELARAELVKLQQGDQQNVALWKKFIEVSMVEFDGIYRRLGVSFDVTLGESFYNPRLAATVDLLKRQGIAEQSEGAMVVFFTKERDGEDMPPFLVLKGDGGFNYGTTDVAGVLYRVETWSPSRIIIVTDERQQLHFRQLFATARRLGVKCSLEHIWFGLMRLPEGTISTRKGKGLIYLDDLLDEAERRALEVASEASPDLPEDERKAIARAVGIGAVKYNDLSKDRQTTVTFTWDKALSLSGNSGPYLQYAYARIRSILRKAVAEGGAAPAPMSHELSDVERTLVLKLLGYSEVVEQVAKTVRPHILCDYLYDLAGAFSTFYADHQVLKAETTVRAGRLALCNQVAETLKSGLELLGIDTLDRM